MILLDYMCHRFDLIDRWRFHFVGANWANVTPASAGPGGRCPRRRCDGGWRTTTQSSSATMSTPSSSTAPSASGAERLTTYIERDQPEIVLVDNMDAAYVSESVDRIDFSDYERHDFWGEAVDKEGQATPDCTTVWLRKKAPIPHDPGT